MFFGFVSQNLVISIGAPVAAFKFCTKAASFPSCRSQPNILQFFSQISQIDTVAGKEVYYPALGHNWP